ncbi:hypothetical protein VE02_09658 [Pseudogymnoascus sp. 03VT05]|nr:hypothetical protein VE02_09658 [Pseudogymnoascus sp. 03VT05]
MAPKLEIHVDGKGSVFRTAERGVVHLIVSSTSFDQSKAFGDVKDKVETLTQKFRSFATKTEDGRPHPLAGITTFTVSPLNTSSYFQRDSNYHELKYKPKEFVIRSTAEVVFRNLELLSEVSHELANMAHVSIVSSEWRLTGPTRIEIEREARVKAIEDAVQKANDYAGVVGRQVVAVEIKDGPSSNSASRPYYFGGAPAQMQQQQMQQAQKMAQHQMANANPASVAMDGPALEPRTITVSAQVNANGQTSTPLPQFIAPITAVCIRSSSVNKLQPHFHSVIHTADLDSVHSLRQFASARYFINIISIALPIEEFNLAFFVMAPPVGPYIDIQPLQDNPPNEAIQADADRVHQAMNSGLRLVEEESQLDYYMHGGFMMVPLFTWCDSIEADGSGKLYDSVKTHLISEWTKNRNALVSAIKEPPGQRPNFAPVSSMYLAGGRNDRGHAYRGLEHRPQDRWLDTESYIYSAIIMQILTAWDESVRQGSTEFFDRQFADAIATWNQNRGDDVHAAAPAPVAEEYRGLNFHAAAPASIGGEHHGLNVYDATPAPVAGEHRGLNVHVAAPAPVAGEYRGLHNLIPAPFLAMREYLARNPFAEAQFGHGGAPFGHDEARFAHGGAPFAYGGDAPGDST